MDVKNVRRGCFQQSFVIPFVPSILGFSGGRPSEIMKLLESQHGFPTWLHRHHDETYDEKSTIIVRMYQVPVGDGGNLALDAWHGVSSRSPGQIIWGADKSRVPKQ